MRRKAGVLIPIEVSILQAALALWARGEADFHGFMIAKALKEQADARLLTAYGTLYRALDRLAKSGMLESEWEDPQIALDEGRPRRRLYRITAAGQAALAEVAKAGAPAIMPSTRPVTP